MIIDTLLELVCVLPAGAAEDGVLALALLLMTETLRFWVTTPVKWGTRSLISQISSNCEIVSPPSLMGIKAIGRKEFQHQLATKFAEGEGDVEESYCRGLGGGGGRGPPAAQY